MCRLVLSLPNYPNLAFSRGVVSGNKIYQLNISLRLFRTGALHMVVSMLVLNHFCTLFPVYLLLSLKFVNYKALLNRAVFEENVVYDLGRLPKFASSGEEYRLVFALRHPVEGTFGKSLSLARSLTYLLAHF